MTRIALTSLLLGLSLALPAASETARTPRDVAEADARALHARVLTLDTHVDIGRGYATEQLDPGRFTNAQVDLPKMRAGGLDAMFLIVYTGQGARDAEGYAKAAASAEDSYRAIRRAVDAYPDQIALATTADAVEAIHASGRKVALIGMENGTTNSVEAPIRTRRWAMRPKTKG
jgi:membrane dipeptidase